MLPPRFFIHKSIQKLCASILSLHGRPGEVCMLFPTISTATRCRNFIKARSLSTPPPCVRVIELIPRLGQDATISSGLCAVLFPADEFKIAKQFWQHSGDGVSSRRAEFCQQELDNGLLREKGIPDEVAVRPAKGPKRYSRVSVDKGHVGTEGTDTSRFVEERFGRNLGVEFVANAKLAVRRRIAGTLRSNVAPSDALALKDEGGRDVPGFTEEDVYLFPSGMSAIFNSHRLLLEALEPRKSVCYGFPYIDTLKILEKFGPGCHFYGHGSAEDLDDLEAKLTSGERVMALFCEFPGNPLLASPDLQRIRKLADQYDFAVIVDETLGNPLNVHVLPLADMVASSLTKVFSGDSNVMGGSMVLNPKSRYYATLKAKLATEYEDNLWAEDALFLERNSRDFVSRIERINANAEAVCELLLQHPKIKRVYYPKNSPTRAFYDACRCTDGGYGGLLSVTFYSMEDAIRFFDAVETAKGPSLGTNFTLTSPYAILAHYGELEWAAKYGVESNLVRVSIGLEETVGLVQTFAKALRVLET
ncbi:pyridoxal phosphate-dependent transferase [Sphaerosporella brunnea]|uniref:cystathionine gamma-synthase n=1 Tax=Sphaerosporella brunnea TaxID=1250544 RepID=A0A5J5ENB8_9PEZI|nr:pyridoxal phosphate-dependent transferase [Sphaerosporella brunnea]